MIKNLITNLKNNKAQLENLDKEYLDKERGTIYHRRKQYIENRIQDIYKKVLEYGKGSITYYLVKTTDEKGVIAQYSVAYSNNINIADVGLLVQLRTGAHKVIDVNPTREIKVGEINLL